VIEKHLTLSRADGGVDSAFSLEPTELQGLVAETARAWKALGGVHYGPTTAEEASLKFRRSLYIVEDMRAGEILTERNLRRIRPGLGLSPGFYYKVLGQAVKRDVRKGTPLTWDLL
jgi:N-acetylneuraminate synthase